MSELGLTAVAGTVLIEIEERSKAAYGLDDEGKTASGFFMADPEFQGVPNTGVVVAVGAGVDFPREGDRVVFSADGNEGFKWNDRKLFKIKAEKVAGVFK